LRFQILNWSFIGTREWKASLRLAGCVRLFSKSWRIWTRR